MTGLTADQIIERIANANGVEQFVIRCKVEQLLQKLIADRSKHYCVLLENVFPEREPTKDELIVVLEQELYNALMPRFPGWEWDGEGYGNVRLLGKKR